jgi:topoisomerase IA-like protein
MSLTIRFYEILNDVVELKDNKNYFYLTEKKYNISLREVKVAKSVNVKKNSSLSTTYRFDIVNLIG